MYSKTFANCKSKRNVKDCGVEIPPRASSLNLSSRSSGKVEEKKIALKDVRIVILESAIILIFILVVPLHGQKI